VGHEIQLLPNSGVIFATHGLFCLLVVSCASSDTALPFIRQASSPDSGSLHILLLKRFCHEVIE
jgi:hypothetical protein